MAIDNINSLADRLAILFGHTQEERSAARERLLSDPDQALQEIGFRPEAKIIEHFKQLNPDDKLRIVDRFENLSQYNTNFRDDPIARIKLLKDMQLVFEAFMQWEAPPGNERGNW